MSLDIESPYLFTSLILALRIHFTHTSLLTLSAQAHSYSHDYVHTLPHASGGHL